MKRKSSAKGKSRVKKRESSVEKIAMIKFRAKCFNMEHTTDEVREKRRLDNEQVQRWLQELGPDKKMRKEEL